MVQRSEFIDPVVEVARLYAEHGNFSLIAYHMREKTGQFWDVTKVKRHLVMYVKEQTGLSKSLERTVAARRHFPGRPARY